MKIVYGPSNVNDPGPGGPALTMAAGDDDDEGGPGIYYRRHPHHLHWSACAGSTRPVRWVSKRHRELARNKAQVDLGHDFIGGYFSADGGQIE